MTATTTAPRNREAYIMARLNLATYGIEIDDTTFKDMIATSFHNSYPALGTVDELLVRPREALRLCDQVRDALAAGGEGAAYDLPDDVILRTLLNMRKSPGT